MKCSHVLVVLTASIWVLFAIVGFDVVHNAQILEQSSSPRTAAMRYYVYAPLAVVALILGAAALLSHKALRHPAIIVVVLALFGFLPYALGFTGGM